MAFEILYLASGLLIGGVLIYVFLSRRMYHELQEKSSVIASRLFEMQKGQLEQSIRETYFAQLGQWKATELAETVQSERIEALEKSRAVLKGKIGEQLAPFLPEFLSFYNPSEARFLGSPIDYVVFKNLSSTEEITPLEIVLLDIKTGNSTLSKNQRRIEEAIACGSVKFHTIRLDRAFEGRETNHES